MVNRTVKEKMGFSFLFATVNRIYAILKIVPKFMVGKVAQSKSSFCKNF